MKIYAVIVTIVAVLALGVVGFGVWQGIHIKAAYNKQSDELRLKRDELKSLRDQTQKQASDIETLNRILRASSNSLVHPGDLKVTSFNAPSVTEIDTNIEKITDQNMQEKVKSDWNTFSNSKTINDYRQFIQSVSDAISGDITSLK